MAATKRCSEPGCGEKLEYPDGTPKPLGTLTCGVKCRSARARRLKREEKAKALARKGGRPAHVQAVTEALKNGDALHEAAVAEFQPLVREAMTASVLSSINDLIGMAPEAMHALKSDMSSQDETIRQRAYQLWFKYTMGNPSVAPPSQEAQPQGLTVQFNLPRPGDDPSASIAPPSDAVELRTCDECGAEKPSPEFVAGSSRCELCHDGTRALLKERFGDAYGG